MTPERSNNSIPTWLKFLLTIAAIVFIIITLGAFTNNKQEKLEESKDSSNEEDINKINYNEQEKLIEIQKVLNQEKRNRIKAINSEVKELSYKKLRAQKREPLILLIARIIVGLFLISANLVYFTHFNPDTNELGNQLNFNALLTILYAFFAFIIYGTPSKLERSLKNKITKSLKKRQLKIKIDLEVLFLEKKGIEDYLIKEK